MTLIQAVRDYLATYTGLKTGAPLWVDYIGSVPVEYAIIPTPGSKIVEKYLDGGSLREFPFAFQSVESTADNLERLDSIGLFEAISDWFETQTEADALPILSSKQTAISIEAASWGFLYEEGKSDTGIYQLQCKLTYEQRP